MDTTHSQMNILLCDDDADDRLFFKEAMTELKVQNDLKVFENGSELMDYLHHPDTLLPHILFLDINMPCKSGLECLKEIREHAKFKNLVIAIYSTSNSEEDIEETFTNGANIFIKKPSDFSLLKKAIHHVLNINWQYHTDGLNKETFFLSL
ncbi:response regulator [Flavobacterium antarcticum]|uniref:response regulator n=1 Tax=Flavobacterium antarcticum TaxID=271155 RepID=UPI0003B62F38|nr:response regulator [Flavobacterium antarcticum]